MEIEKPIPKQSELVELRRSAIFLRLAAGESASTVAKELGLNQAHLYTWLSSSRGLQHLRSALGDARAKIESRLPSLVDMSIDTLEQAMRNGSIETKLKAAHIALSAVARLSIPKTQGTEAQTYDHHQL